jgi:hypothetical protein
MGGKSVGCGGPVQALEYCPLEYCPHRANDSPCVPFHSVPCGNAQAARLRNVLLLE